MELQRRGSPRMSSAVALEESDQILLSILIALDDHRDQALSAVDSWLAQDGESLAVCQIVVAGPGDEPDIESAIRGKLRPIDRFVSTPAGNVNQQFNAAFDASSARMVLFTESHVVAEAGCLRSVLHEMRERPFRTAALSSRGLNRGRCPDAVEQIFDEELPGRLAAGWNLAVIRGFFIERALFEEAGRFAEPYEHFAQLILGVFMRQAGLQPRLLQDAWVQHANETQVGQLWRQLTLFGRNEVQFHAENPHSGVRQHLPRCHVWEDRQRYTRRGAAARAAASLREGARSLVTGDILKLSEALSVTVSSLPTMVLGPAWARGKALVGLAGTVVRLHAFAWAPKLYYKAFCAMWAGMIRYGRLTEVAARLAAEARGATPLRDRQPRTGTTRENSEKVAA